MSDNCGCSDHFFAEGEWVESLLNSDVFGIVIGGSGAHVQVQLAGSLAIHTFHAATLRPLDDPGDGPEGNEDNVIDFTKARDLRNAKAQGAA